MSELSHTLFGTTHPDTGQLCARAVLILLYGLLLVRVLGRRVFGKWAALDIVVAIVIGSNLSRAMTGNAPLWGTLAATTVLMVLHILLAQLAARSRTGSQWIEGRPVTLAREGRADRRACVRHSVSTADIDEALRGHGLAELSEAQELVLEPSGTISVRPRA